jgi:hypothetical protein
MVWRLRARRYEWLINTPEFEQIVVGAAGLPLWVISVDPRAIALHKYWVSRRDDREPPLGADASQRRCVRLRAVFAVGVCSKRPISLASRASAGRSNLCGGRDTSGILVPGEVGSFRTCQRTGILPAQVDFFTYLLTRC